MAAKTATSEYQAWVGMKSRCLNKNSAQYSDYGGRGIMVHQDWVSSFDSFIAHVGQKPSEQHSLDRINNDGNYESGNVRWATAAEQAANKRRNGPHAKMYACKDCGKEMKTVDVRRHGPKCEGAKK